MTTRRLRIGLYGCNGHQITGHIADHPRAIPVAIAGVGDAELPDGYAGVKHYDTLDELLSNPDIDLVSLCSPRRADQATDAVRCLEAGKHVFGEKPSALSVADLDRIIVAADATGQQYREMAGTLCQQPYAAMRKVVLDGRIGTVIQVLAQKSYPWHERRPADEMLDGGLATQVGVYIGRFVEHIAGARIASFIIEETQRGNPHPDSQCRMAMSVLMTLEGGGVASAICNYLNPAQSQCWGYEIVRIFGAKGVVESNPMTNEVRVLPLAGDPELLEQTPPTRHYVDLFIDSLLDGTPMPLSSEDELSPTRWAVQAKFG